MYKVHVVMSVAQYETFCGMNKHGGFIEPPDSRHRSLSYPLAFLVAPCTSALLPNTVTPHPRRRREEEARRQRAIAEMEEAALAAEGKYGSLQEEAAAKTKKLAKLQRRIAVGW